LYIVYRKYFR